MKQALLRSPWVVVLMFPALAAAAAVPLTLEAPGRSAEASELPAGVVVDPGGTVLYIMNPDGGIDAVAAGSGDLLWSSSDAARPLALFGDQLIAQGPPAERAGVLDIVLLGSADGRRQQSLSIGLPEGIWAAIDQGMDTTFDTRAVVFRGVPYVLWRHTRKYSRGVAPSPGTAMEQKSAGASRLDLVAGRAAAVDPSTLQLQPELPVAVRQSAQQWADAGELSTRPAAAGDTVAATRLVDERLVLERWNRTGTPLPDIELFSRPYLLELRSADSRHLLVAEHLAPEAGQEYNWSIFDLQSGQRLGEIESQRSHAWYLVHDSTLIYIAPAEGRRVGGELVVAPIMLRAVQVGGGRALWERPLRDTSYRGTFPQ